MFRQDDAIDLEAASTFAADPLEIALNGGSGVVRCVCGVSVQVEVIALAHASNPTRGRRRAATAPGSVAVRPGVLGGRRRGRGRGSWYERFGHAEQHGLVLLQRIDPGVEE